MDLNSFHSPTEQKYDKFVLFCCSDQLRVCHLFSYLFTLPAPQVKFHYQTRTCPEVGEQRLLDDSKKLNRPMELIIGKKFKLEVWEAILKRMSLNEVAKFRVNKAVCTAARERLFSVPKITVLFLFGNCANGKQ